MSELKLYTQVKDFLKESESFLLENEINNNLILGNCQNIIATNRVCEDCYFLTVIDNESIDACSIKVNSKIILSSGSFEAIEEIYRCYKDTNIPFEGVIGNKNSVEIFIKLYKAQVSQSRLTLVQSLEEVKEIHLANGKFEVAKESDLPIITKWLLQFFEDEKLRPSKTPEEVEAFVKALKQRGDLFSWSEGAKLRSVAAIVRKTKNTAIIGLVYTPEEYRGKGYAKSVTHSLSEWILKNGFSKSGLLVFDSNEPAKKIYQEIGYNTVSELLDVDFE